MQKRRCLYTIFILLIGLFFMQNCQKRLKTGSIFRLIDHFDRIEFIQTPLNNISVAKNGSWVSSICNQTLKEMIIKNMNQDYVKGSPIHPLKLKFTKGPSPHSGKGRRTKNVILSPPTTEFSVTLKIDRNSILKFGYGVINEIWEDTCGKVRFDISVEQPKKKSSQYIFQDELNPGIKQKHRKWFESEIDLGKFEGQKIKLIFKTSYVKKEERNYCLSVWVNPVIINPSFSNERLNVILISVDTVRSDHLGCYGYSRETSPLIDSIARRGILFRNTVSQAPYTLSSHMSLLTSKYPSFHKVNYIKESRLDSQINTLAEYFYNYGYRTYAITGGGQLSSDYGFAEGFETYIEFTTPLKDAIQKVQETINFIMTHQESSWFIFFHTYKPHAPYTPLSPYDKMFDPNYKGDVNGSLDTINAINSKKLHVIQRDIDHIVSLYDGEIRETDAALKILFNYLEKNKLHKRTLIVITSDHGEEFGEHGKVGIHSHTLFDELILVPFILYCPGVFPEGKIIKEQVQSIDIMPTILDLVGIKTKDNTIQGASQIPLINKIKPKRHSSYAYSERLALDNYFLTSLRTTNFKHIFEDNKNTKNISLYYFDLQNDPREHYKLNLTDGKAREFFSQIQFLIEERKIASMVQKKGKLDEKTIEILRTLGYIK